MSVASEVKRNVRQFDLACQNRDLPTARRLAAELHGFLFPGAPLDLWKIDAVVRTYAAKIHGWEIPGSGNG